MRNFLRGVFGIDTIETLISIGYGQMEVIAELHAENERLKLQHVRQTRDLVEQFWISQEAGLDVREQLFAGLTDLRDHVARLEEHAR